MNKDLPKMDKLFVQLLENGREEPPENSWQAIENELNRRDARKYKTKYISLRRILICILLTGICLLLSYVLQEAFEKPLIKNTDSVASLQKNSNETGIASSNQSNKPGNNKKRVRQFYLPVAKTNVATSVHNINSDPFFSRRLPDTIPATPPVFQELMQHTDSGDFFIPLLKDFIRSDSSADKPQNQSPAKKNPVKRERHPFAILPFFSFDHITGRFHEQYEYEDQAATQTAKKEKPDMSYTFGLLSEYNLSNKIAVQAGLLFSNAFTAVPATVVKALQVNTGPYKFKLATTYGIAEIKRAGTGQPQPGDSLLVNNGMLILKTVAIPVVLKYKFKPGRLNLNTITGIAINRIISDQEELEYTTASNREKETIQHIEGLRNTYGSLIGGAEIAFDLNKKISVTVNPVVRYAITPVNKGTPVKTYPVSITAGASLRIKL